MPSISIIIPVFNVKKYLKQCLDSVCNQTFSDIEIICVNDCSTDNSLQILQEFASKDKRFKIIDCKDNIGVSSARNRALECASGKYIGFVDSDDWIAPDYFETLHSIITKLDLDIVVNTNIKTVINGQDVAQFYPNKTLDNYVGFINSRKCIHKLIWNPWVHLCKKEFFDKYNIQFPDGYVLEDMYMQAVCFAYVDKIYITRDTLYHYRLSEDSIVGTLSQVEMKSIKSHIKILDKIYDYYETNNLLDNVEEMKFINTYIMADNYVCDDEVIKRLYNYFKRIEPYINQHKNWYGMVELEYFNDVLQDKNIVKTKNYKKRFVVQEIRNKMKVKI